MLVAFDGPNKLIIVNNGVTALDVQTDLYSEWKKWAMTGDNAKFAPAFESIGGQPLPGGLFAGSTYFIINGWKIRPYEGNHELTINGNLFTDDGSDATISTLGNYKVTIRLLTTSLAQGVEAGSGLTPAQATQLIEIWKILGLDVSATLQVTNTYRVAGGINQAINIDSEGNATVQRT